MSINKLLVENFQLLALYEKNSDKFTKLVKIFGSLKMNDKLLMKFMQDFDANKDDISGMIYFKSTSFCEIFAEMTEEERKLITSNLERIYTLCQEKLMKSHSTQETHVCDSNCSHNSQMDELLKNKKLKKMLKKKGAKQGLEDYMKNTMGASGNNLEDMLKSLTGNNDMLSGVAKKLIDNPTVKELGDIFQNKETMNKIFNFVEHIIEQNKELKLEVERIMKLDLVNLEKVSELATKFMTKFDDLKDGKDIMGKLDKIKVEIIENNDVKLMINKVETSIESGLIDPSKLKTMVLKVFTDAAEDFKKLNIFDLDKLKTFGPLLNGFGLNFGSLLGLGAGGGAKPKTSAERQERRMKDFRRKRRAELKKNKKNKRK